MSLLQCCLEFGDPLVRGLDLFGTGLRCFELIFELLHTAVCFFKVASCCAGFAFKVSESGDLRLSATEFALEFGNASVGGIEVGVGGGKATIEVGNATL